MPRGGQRQGTPGTAYTNRSDLNANKALPAATGPSRTYGDSAASQRAQNIIPMAPQPAAGSAAQQLQPAAPPAPPAPVTDLYAPSDRPDEPITAGLPTGAGPGPEALNMGEPIVDELRALFLADPGNPDLQELLELYDEGVY